MQIRHTLGLLFSLAVTSVLPTGPVTGAPSVSSEQATITDQDRRVYQELLDNINNKIHVSTLSNGMTVVCIPQSHTNKAVVSMTYDVGFVHEKPREFGMAHIVEHMIFKGTHKMREGDLEKIAQSLGVSIMDGGLNANTYFNRTHYYFVADANNWRPFVDITADCAQNMDWDSSVLDSELAAIFQEIKMRGGDRAGSDDEVIGSWLPDNHPYKHRGIGYKEQLLSFTREDVLAFYKKYYTPDRAVLMVVGNIDPAEVVAHAEQSFASFTGQAEQAEEVPEPFFNNFAQTDRVIYIPEHKYSYSFVWPTVKRQTADEAAIDYVMTALQQRLQHDWIDEKGWCLMLVAGQQNFRDVGFAYVEMMVKPEHKDVPFAQLLGEQIQKIIDEGITNDEYAQVHKTTMRSLISFAESPLLLSNIIKESFFPHRGPQGWYDSMSFANHVTHQAIRMAAHQYLRPFMMHSAKQMPLPEVEHQNWFALQQKTDAHEREMLELRARQTTASEAVHEESVEMPERQDLTPSSAIEPDTVFALSNGLKVYYKRNTLSPTLSCSIVLNDVEGCAAALGVRQKGFALQAWGGMVEHGTKHKTKKQLDDAFARRGISHIAMQGVISVSMLKQDADEALCLLSEMMNEPALPDDILTRKKKEFVQTIEMNKNNPQFQIRRHLQETLYSVYPHFFTQEEQVKHALAITRDDVVDFHNIMTDPATISCVMVGDIEEEDARELLEKHLGTLHGTGLGYAAPELPALSLVGQESHIELPTEEVMIRLVRPGVVFDDPMYPFYQVFSEYLASKVFDIREQTGLFYTGGAILTPEQNRRTADFMIGTQTGPTRVAAVKKKIRELLTQLHEHGMSHDEFATAKAKWLHKDAHYMHTGATMSGFLSGCLSQRNDWHFREKHRAAVEALTFEQANAVVRQVCDPATWTTVTAGRMQGTA